MKPADNIEKLIRDLRVLDIDTNARMDQRIVHDALEARGGPEQMQSAAIEPTMWRTIMKMKLTKLVTAAAIIITVLVGLRLIGWPIAGTSVAFANVVEQIRNARTVTFVMEIRVGEQTMRMENVRKGPGLKRTVMPGGLVVINDLTENKAILINHSRKQYTQRNLGPSDDGQGFFEQMRKLPGQANEVLDKKEMDGRMVQGFCITENGIDAICWIDVQTGDLVRVEGQFPNAPNTRIVATDFEFDVELDDALFSLTPPAGYASEAPIGESPGTDSADADRQGLIYLLRWWATNVEGGVFPPSLEPAEFARVASEMKDAGKVRKFDGSQDEKMQHMTKLTRGMQYVMMMKPENDWHYAGKGVELGDAGAAICWYRPEGSETYRVIYGDLRIKDVASQDLP